jgi:hypothetical protein
MKKGRIYLLSAIALVLTVSLLAGCKKEKDEELEFDTQSAQDNSLAETSFNDIMEMSFQAIENQSAGLSTYRISNPEGSLLSNCATVTVTPDSSGQGGSIVIDFGSHACLCTDLRYRKGVVNVTYTDTYRDSGAVITSTAQNYFVGMDSTNMYEVIGTKSVTNNGHNSRGNLWYSISVSGQIRNKHGATMSWSSQRQREWIAGETTTGWTGWLDDVYSITGTASGTTFEGKTYTAQITNPLIIALNCRWIKQGTFELTPGGLSTRTFDYGSGGCDNDATITVNGSTFNIKLR